MSNPNRPVGIPFGLTTKFPIEVVRPDKNPGVVIDSGVNIPGDSIEKTSEIANEQLASISTVNSSEAKPGRSSFFKPVKVLVANACAGSIFATIFNYISLTVCKSYSTISRATWGVPPFITYADHYTDFFANSHNILSQRFHDKAWTQANATQEGYGDYITLLQADQAEKKLERDNYANSLVVLASIMVGYSFATLINAKSDTSLKGRACQLGLLVASGAAAVLLCNEAIIDINVPAILTTTLAAGAVGGFTAFWIRSAQKAYLQFNLYN